MKPGYVIYVVLFFAGCGMQAREAARRAGSDTGAATTEARAIGSDREESESAALEDPIERKIIYEAEVRLVIDDFSGMEAAISRLTEEHGGYLAEVSIERASGEQRSGRWEARIPVDQFEPFMDAISELGVAERRNQTAQDVTEEYVDLEARIANKKRLEERILTLLERSEGNIKDVIEVERELGRVRGEIEQMEGRLRYLKNRTQFTTVVIIAREQRDYVPPMAPTLSGRIRNAWGDSLSSLRSFGASVTVAVVFAFPWLVVFVVVAAPTACCVRRYKQLGKRNADSERRDSAASG